MTVPDPKRDAVPLDLRQASDAIVSILRADHPEFDWAVEFDGPDADGSTAAPVAKVGGLAGAQNTDALLDRDGDAAPDGPDDHGIKESA